MNETEAMVYVDLIIEKLYAWGIIHPSSYGSMTEYQRQELARLVAEKSEE